MPVTKLGEAAGLLSEVLDAFKVNGLKTPPESLMGRIEAFLAADTPLVVGECRYTCNICNREFTGPIQGAKCTHCDKIGG